MLARWGHSAAATSLSSPLHTHRAGGDGGVEDGEDEAALGGRCVVVQPRRHHTLQEIAGKSKTKDKDKDQKAEGSVISRGR